MNIPQQIPRKIIVPMMGVLAGIFGFGVGMLARQPEINVLHRQVRQLQAKAEELEETVRTQNDELSGLFQRYHALNAWN